MPRTIVDVSASAVDRITVEAMRGAGLDSPADAAARIADVLAMANEWHAGRLPLTEVGRLCTGRDRFLAVRFGPRPVPSSLLALLDAFVDATPGPDGYAYRTKHGLYTEADIATAGGTYRRDPDGRVAISFPARVEPGKTAGSRWR